MIKKMVLVVPGEYTFENFFAPRFKKTNLEIFDVDTNRRGIQRKGNNHLVVFLDYVYKKPLDQFSETQGIESETIVYLTQTHIEFFKQMFDHQKELSVYALSYDARMSLIAWEVITHIADDKRVLVEEGFGEWMKGPELARELKDFLDFKQDGQKA